MKRFALLIAMSLAAASCNNDVAGLGPPSNPANETFDPSLGVDIAQMTKLPSGVYYADLIVGTSTDSVGSKTTSIKVNYAGYLTDGKLFDTGTGVSFNLADIISGLRLGMQGMRVGGKRKIVIPSELGYGGRAIKNTDNTIKIPRQSTLIFDVELLSVTNPTTTTT